MCVYIYIYIYIYWTRKVVTNYKLLHLNTQHVYWTALCINYTILALDDTMCHLVKCNMCYYGLL